MSSYTCENFQDDIPNIFSFDNMRFKWVLSQKTTKLNFWDEEIFGMSSYTSWKNYYLI